MNVVTWFVSFVLGAATAGSSTDGPQIGDVVVTIEPAEVSLDGRITGYVDLGNVLVVGDRDGDRIRVNYATSGWIAATKAARPDAAIEQFSAAMQRMPERADLHLARGRAYHAAGDIPAAIADLSTAVLLAPNDVRPRLMRSRSYEADGDFEAALADLNRAAQLAPGDAQVFRVRGGLHAQLGRYADSLADYNRAVRLDPKDAAVANDRAWLSATCPDSRYRNGRQAIFDATFACKHCDSKTFNRLGTLAAASAEAGDFDTAVRVQTEALTLTPATLRLEGQQRLKLYSKGKAYRDYPRTGIEGTSKARQGRHDK